jgi:hypothetical protein
MLERVDILPEWLKQKQSLKVRRLRRLWAVSASTFSHAHDLRLAFGLWADDFTRPQNDSVVGCGIRRDVLGGPIRDYVYVSLSNVSNCPSRSTVYVQCDYGLWISKTVYEWTLSGTRR